MLTMTRVRQKKQACGCKSGRYFGVIGLAVVLGVTGTAGLAVTSKVARHRTIADFSKGKTKDAIVDSRGTIRLGRASEVLVDKFEGVWSANCIVVSNGVVFIGTSPNGGVYEYKQGKLTKVYSADPCAVPDANEPNEPNKPVAVGADKQLANEHIFAMATDSKGQLLVGISGRRCALCRLEGKEMKTIFEPNDAKYIFAIRVDDDGNVYLGTGPEGKVYRLDASLRKPEMIYDSPDKNILSLAVGGDGLVYAGSDSRGLVYKIDPMKKQATVLYDSELQEITAMLFSGGELYAAATSANVLQAESRFAVRPPTAGRPEEGRRESPSPGEDEGGVKLEAANTKEATDEKPPEAKPPMRRPPKPAQASYVYRVSADGFVTDIFDEAAVFFCLAADGNQLLVGTGNSAQLYNVEAAPEQHALIYEDEQASQLTSVAAGDDGIYVGMANPARLVKLAGHFAREGTYTSDLIDAGQPAKWGKLHIEAEIPAGCKVLAASRSGNVKDVNDASFSAWTQAAEITGPTELGCPLGRFCQYKLVLQSSDGKQSPVVREVTVANAVPNLAPRVEAVSANRAEGPGKSGTFKISYAVKDDNGDKLIYKIDFRKVGAANWIEIEDAAEAETFEWDSKTVEDGRYEIRVTASDERSNSPETKKTGIRISDAIVVDNTGPVVEKFSTEKKGLSLTVKLRISDELSVIGKSDYTVDSNAEWKSAVPDDGVCDTTEEDFTIAVEDLKAGEHVVSIRVSDDVGNATYRSFSVNVAGG